MSQPHIALVAMGAFCLTVSVGSLVWPFAGKYARAPREAEITLHSLRWLESDGTWREAAWGDIAEVYRVERILNGFRIQSCRVKTAERDVTFLATVDGYDQMAASIQTATTRSMLPAKAADLERGKPVAFGPVTLYPDGVGLLVETGPGSPGERFVRWEEVREVTAKRGRLMVFPIRKPYPVLDHLPVPMGAIPNYVALLEMLSMRGFRV